MEDKYISPFDEDRKNPLEKRTTEGNEEIISKEELIGFNTNIIVAAVLGLVILFTLLIILSSVNHKGKTSNAKITYKEEKKFDIPGGKVGDWAKSLVYIESGRVVNDQVYPEKSGSGSVITKNKWIITNSHVIHSSDAVIITFYDGKRFLADVIKEDPVIDIAILKLRDENNYPSLTIDKEEAKIGDKIMVMGFPLGSSLGSELTLTDGIVSSKRKDQNGNLFFYQVNAAINPGNSGGPLLNNETGKLIGIVTSKIKDAENIGFARPITILLREFSLDN